MTLHDMTGRQKCQPRGVHVQIRECFVSRPGTRRRRQLASPTAFDTALHATMRPETAHEKWQAQISSGSLQVDRLFMALHGDMVEEAAERLGGVSTTGWRLAKV